MRAGIGVLWFIVVVFLDPIESMMNLFTKRRPPPRPQITHPILAASYYLPPFDGRNVIVQRIHQSLVKVGIRKIDNVVYVIGYIEEKGPRSKKLCPFVHSIGNRIMSTKTRIKIRLDGIFAYRYEAVPLGDPLEHFFYNQFDLNDIQTFQILESGELHLEPVKNQIIPAMPNYFIKLSARSYRYSKAEHEQNVASLQPGFAKVGIWEENRAIYIIGCIKERKGSKPELVPFIAAIPEFHMEMMRIKIRVDGLYAYQYVVIPEGNFLDDYFFKPFDKDYIRTVEYEGPRGRPLEPEFRPAAPGETSSGQASTSAGQTGLHQISSESTGPQLARLISLAPAPKRDKNAQASTRPEVVDFGTWENVESYRRSP